MMVLWIHPGEAGFEFLPGVGQALLEMEDQ